jgi:hypothetical protein
LKASALKLSAVIFLHCLSLLPDRSVQPDDNHRNYGAFLWGSAVSAQPTARQLVPRSSVWGLFNQVRDKSSTSSKINILTPKYRADRLASVVMWAPNKSSEPGGVMRHFKLGGRAAGLFGACIIASFSAMNDARADQGGVSFWLPGLFGSLAAALQQPGWSLTAVYYHTSVSADADVAKAREITIRQNPPHGHCKCQRESRCASRPRIRHADLHLRYASLGRPTYAGRHRNLWPCRHILSGDGHSRAGNTARHISVRALRQHQRLGHRFR